MAIVVPHCTTSDKKRRLDSERQKRSLHTSYSTSVATVVEHSLCGGRFTLRADEHAACTGAKGIMYCINMGNDPDIPRPLDRGCVMVLCSTRGTAAKAFMFGRISSSLGQTFWYTTYNAQTAEAHRQ